MCLQSYNHGPNVTDSLLKDSKFKGKVSEYKKPLKYTLPETVDWRTAGAVTFVKDQVSMARLHWE